MEVPTHILDQRKEDVAIETLNPSMEGKSIPMSQVEGARIFNPPTNNIEVLIDL
jgi:hypothetical protein